MTDSSGNTTTINLTKYKETATKLKLTYNSITRNGVTISVPNTTIVYNWSGFSQPINDTVYNPTQNKSVFKSGSTIPVKFTLTNAEGTPQTTTTPPLWLPPQQLNAMNEPVEESIYTDPASTGTTFTLTDTQYKYNWKTTGTAAGYWYRLGVQLPDGTKRYVVVVGIK